MQLFIFLKKNNYIIIFISIILFAFLLRIYNLSKNPPGFFCDEAAIGYNAWSILTTGKDEYGIQLPLFFKSFGDYRLPIPIYANIPSVMLFGLQEISIRLTAVIFGIINIIFIILIVKEVLNKSAGLIAGFLLAITPWHIHMSRWGSEYIYFPSLISIAIYFLLKSIHEQRFLVLSSFFFALSLYTYYPTLFVTPLFLLFSGIIFIVMVRKHIHWEYIFLSFIIFSVMCIPLVSAFVNKTLLTRWNSVNYTHLPVQKQMKQSIQFYLQHFGPDFLFFKGDVGLPGHFVTRHSVRESGELYFFSFPFLLIGFFYTLFKKQSFGSIIIWILLFLYPLGSIVTPEGILATRSIIGILPLSFFSAIGLTQSIQLLLRIKSVTMKILTLCVVCIIIFISAGIYLYQFYVLYPKYSADYWGWQYGPKDIISYFLENQSNYDEEIMFPEFNAPYIFFKFYAPHDCKKCILGTPDNNQHTNKKQLFALPAHYLQENPNIIMKKRKTIFYPNTSVAFFIGEIVQYKK
jgi:4-amino-4-deoxy-L-arabinose transferase-like glycosyltransferase